MTESKLGLTPAGCKLEVISRAHKGSVWAFEVCLSKVYPKYSWVVMGKSDKPVYQAQGSQKHDAGQS